jgi:hydrogenase expression/formation protein HypD
LKYVDEFRKQAPAMALAERIRRLGEELGQVRLMEVCGTHTMSIFRNGIRGMLPSNIRLLSGPGCPVCVTPTGTIDLAIALARRPEVVVATFGDMMRVPGSDSSLERERAAGADVRVIYSPLDAVRFAADQPERKVVLLSVGFETTTPGMAASLLQAEAQAVPNFYLLCAHKLIPPAMLALTGGAEGVRLDGFLCPAHVCTVIGSEALRPVATERGIPCVVAGFEPLDILRGIEGLVAQVAEDRAEVENVYRRAVRPEGNPVAIATSDRVFETADTEWRGLGIIPGSGLAIREEYRHRDITHAFPLELAPGRDHPGCACGEVLAGRIEPPECGLFGKTCTPQNPIGPCMVSSEGTCSAHYKYGELDE